MSSPSAESSPPPPGRATRRGHKPAERFHGFVSLQSRGAINLPTELRKRFSLDAPGAQLELTEREDGVLEMRPMVAVPARQAGFWTPQWQAGEAEVDEHVRRGEVVRFDSLEDLMADLDAPDDGEGEGEQGTPPAGRDA